MPAGAAGIPAGERRAAGPAQQSARSRKRDCRRSRCITRFTTRNCRSSSWSSSRSLTGKSPSTTGFGSEGALTKGPFNALWPVVDLNNALVSVILTDTRCSRPRPGYIGPHYRVDHDISMLVPEIWCRMRVAGARSEVPDPERLPGEGRAISRFDGRTVLASRLGYRITQRVRGPLPGPDFRNAGRCLSGRDAAPGDSGSGHVRGRRGRDRRQPAPGGRGVLRRWQHRSRMPAAQSAPAHYVQRAFGDLTLQDPRLRAMFTREAVLASDWYTERLRHKQRKDIASVAAPSRRACRAELVRPPAGPRSA